MAEQREPLLESSDVLEDDNQQSPAHPATTLASMLDLRITLPLVFMLSIWLVPVLGARGVPEPVESDHIFATPWLESFCRAPHVTPSTYPPVKARTAALEHVLIFQRHHRRTPDNLLPREATFNETWSCEDIATTYAAAVAGYDGPRVHTHIATPARHPFKNSILPGTCDQGQLTAAGLRDAVQHGRDVRATYAHLFPGRITPDDLHIRTSPAIRTFEVSAGFLAGLEPSSIDKTWPVYVQPVAIDNIVPSYACPAADTQRQRIEAEQAWLDHLAANTALQRRLDSVLGTSNRASWHNWYDHYFDALTSRQCNSHFLPCHPVTGECVTQEDADKVYALGSYEYDYIWRASPLAQDYVDLTFGAMFEELADNLLAMNASGNVPKMLLYVGHDGSMIRLAAGLGFPAPLAWPALGSQIVIEVWRASDGLQTRILHNGQLVEKFSWQPLQQLVAILQARPNCILWGNVECIDFRIFYHDDTSKRTASDRSALGASTVEGFLFS
ncbi:uncharacterized protein L969DRAFT_104438 [Mixia osmundae IAM 14324]|uniref:Acid phosphatase n=1 Tax=Mixia osmundae (strain CBS 9802 / IAM 14324 / JCM 22182 / KY 12970) TaxID=764103 RepID=G7E823_MIXOS|nr:uncharacterized protein L969DRAFT_104438 [Mixia osmundae IAM 14324]KEI38584.1 hypothetical protein L969DRAFT_104438 [Mixia osmundae IAM 14324]GAA98983.1 hypothetical protein E5Q_05672 [Mixia osmundae IAM 14324]